MRQALVGEKTHTCQQKNGTGELQRTEQLAQDYRHCPGDKRHRKSRTTPIDRSVPDHRADHDHRRPVGKAVGHRHTIGIDLTQPATPLASLPGPAIIYIFAALTKPIAP